MSGARTYNAEVQGSDARIHNHFEETVSLALAFYKCTNCIQMNMIIAVYLDIASPVKVPV